MKPGRTRHENLATSVVATAHTWAVVAIIGVLSILISACVIEVNGMQSPLPHDYDSVQWRPLDATAGQPLIVAPGYAAAVENDPATTPDELRQRLAELPSDVRSAELVEIRVGVRQTDEEIVDEKAVVSVGTLRDVDFESGAPDIGIGEPLVERSLASLPRDGDWAILDELPEVEAGALLVIAIRPGGGQEGHWEYGVTPGRVPYGGWPAFIRTADALVVQPDTAMAFQTTFEQDSNLAGILDEAGGGIGDMLNGDLTFVAGYLLAILAVAGGAGYVLTQGREAG